MAGQETNNSLMKWCSVNFESRYMLSFLGVEGQTERRWQLFITGGSLFRAQVLHMYLSLPRRLTDRTWNIPRAFACSSEMGILFFLRYRQLALWYFFPVFVM